MSCHLLCRSTFVSRCLLGHEIDCANGVHRDGEGWGGRSKRIPDRVPGQTAESRSLRAVGGPAQAHLLRWPRCFSCPSCYCACCLLMLLCYWWCCFAAVCPLVIFALHSANAPAERRVGPSEGRQAERGEPPGQGSRRECHRRRREHERGLHGNGGAAAAAASRLDRPSADGQCIPLRHECRVQVERR